MHISEAVRLYVRVHAYLSGNFSLGSVESSVRKFCLSARASFRLALWQIASLRQKKLHIIMFETGEILRLHCCDIWREDKDWGDAHAQCSNYRALDINVKAMMSKKLREKSFVFELQFLTALIEEKSCWYLNMHKNLHKSDNLIHLQRVVKK